MSIINMDLLLDIGIALSKEKDADELLLTILNAAMDITNADGGTLYTVDEEALHFHILSTRSRGILRCAHKGPIDLPPVGLSKSNVCAYSAITRKLVNVADVYTSERFDFTGPRRYDGITGYKTGSMLVVPMEDDQGEIIGVLQLINAQDGEGNIVAFDPAYESVVQSLASQAAIRLTNMNYAAEVTELLDSFVRVMSTAIDARSPYNANHTRNMVKYANRFIDRLKYVQTDWDLETDRKQFIMSVWLHDVGKLIIPLEIMDKDTRLGERMPYVIHKIELYRMWNRIDVLSGVVSSEEGAKRAQEIEDVEKLILRVDRMGFLTDEIIAEVEQLRDLRTRDRNGEWIPLLTEKELASLSIRAGTLTPEERELMQSHVVMTRRMLDSMSFSKNYRNVMDWASRHHEMLDGSGYPDQMKGVNIPKEVRLLSIIDIFDALTAQDRPYKPPMPPEKALFVLENMVRKGQLDNEILNIFKQVKPWEADWEQIKQA